MWARPNRHAPKVEVNASGFALYAHQGRSTSSLSLPRRQLVIGTIPLWFLRCRQPQSKEVLGQPLHWKSQAPSQPQRRWLLPRRCLQTQPLLPNRLLQLRRLPPKKNRNRELITSSGQVGTTTIPIDRVTARVVPQIFRADTLASGRLSTLSQTECTADVRAMREEYSGGAWRSGASAQP